MSEYHRYANRFTELDQGKVDHFRDHPGFQQLIATRPFPSWSEKEIRERYWDNQPSYGGEAGPPSNPKEDMFVAELSLRVGQILEELITKYSEQKLFYRISDSCIVKEQGQAKAASVLVHLTDNVGGSYIINETGIYPTLRTGDVVYNRAHIWIGEEPRQIFTNKIYLNGLITPEEYTQTMEQLALHQSRNYRDQSLVRTATLASFFNHPNVLKMTQGIDPNKDVLVAPMDEEENTFSVTMGMMTFEAQFRWNRGEVQVHATQSGKREPQKKSTTKKSSQKSDSKKMKTPLNKSEEEIYTRVMAPLKEMGYRHRPLRMKKFLEAVDTDFLDYLRSSSVFPLDEGGHESEIHCTFEHCHAVEDNDKIIGYRAIVHLTDREGKSYLPTEFGLHRVESLAKLTFSQQITEEGGQRYFPVLTSDTLHIEVQNLRDTAAFGALALKEDFPYLFGRMMEGLRQDYGVHLPHLEHAHIPPRGQSKQSAILDLSFMGGKHLEVQVLPGRDNATPVIKAKEVS